MAFPVVDGREVRLECFGPMGWQRGYGMASLRNTEAGLTPQT